MAGYGRHMHARLQMAVDASARGHRTGGPPSLEFGAPTGRYACACLPSPTTTSVRSARGTGTALARSAVHSVSSLRAMVCTRPRVPVAARGGALVGHTALIHQRAGCTAATAIHSGTSLSRHSKKRMPRRRRWRTQTSSEGESQLLPPCPSPPPLAPATPSAWLWRARRRCSARPHQYRRPHPLSPLQVPRTAVPTEKVR